MKTKGIFKFINWFIQGIVCLFGILLFASSLVSHNIPDSPIKFSIPIISIFIILIGIMVKNKVIFFSIISILKKYKFVFFLLVIFFQVYMVLTLTTYTGFDTAAIRTWAESGNINSEFLKYYFDHYPNNLMLLYFEKFVYFIYSYCHMDSFILVLNFMNLIFIDLSLIIMLVILKKTSINKNVSTSYSILISIIFAISPWTIITYSDTIVLPFISLEILVSCLLIDGLYVNNVKKNIGLSVIMGITIFISYSLKPSTIILLIGLCIMAIIRGFVGNLWTINLVKKFILIIIIIIGAFGLLNITYSYVNNNQSIVKLKPEKRLTYTHFMMMGLNQKSNGQYYEKDVERSQSFKTVADRQDFNIQEIKQRLKNMGVKGYSIFLIKKFYLTTNDGTLGWGNEGSFLIGNFDQHKLIRSIFYPNGSRIGILRIIAQICWISIVFGITISAFHMSNNFAINYLQLSLIGLLLFLLIFEGGRSRYLIQFLPVILIVSANGWRYVFLYLRRML